MVSIDSCKLRFNLSDVEILDDRVLRKVAEVADDGEVIKDFKPLALTLKSKGITTRYLIQKVVGYGKETKECLVILANAKLLGKRYMEGIDIDTIELFYQNLMQQGIVYIPFGEFLKGALTDCDVKKDFIVSNREAQEQIISTLKHLTKPSKSKLKGYDSRVSDTNIGIQWSKREVATKSSPHVKVYAKDIELKYNSAEFAWEHFQVPHISPTMRLECTIKNKEHFQYVTGKEIDFTIEQVLSLSMKERERVLSSMVLCHIESDHSPSPHNRSSDLSLSDVLACALLNELRSLQFAKVKVNQWAKNKHQAYQARKKLEECWDRYISQDTKMKGADIEGFLKFIYHPQDLIVNTLGVEVDKSPDKLPYQLKRLKDTL
jgi:hypothetical protein